MTDDKDGLPGEGGRAGKAPAQPQGKRPHATLDLEATEIEEPPAHAAIEVEAPPMSAEGDAASRADVPDPEAKPPAAEAEPTRARSGAFGRTLSHLAAGLAGGALAYLAAQWHQPPRQVDALEQAQLSVRTASVEERLAELESVQPSATVLTELPQRLGEFQDRLARLEDASAALAAVKEEQVKLAQQSSALAERLGENTGAAERDRIGKLEERLNLLASTDPGDGRLPQLVAITGKIGEIETALAAQIAEVKKAIAAESESRKAEAAGSGQAAKDNVQRVDRDLAAVRTDTSRLSQRSEAGKADTDRLGAAVHSLKEETTKLSASLAEIKVTIDRELKATAKPADLSAAVAPVADKVAQIEKSLGEVVSGEQARKADAGRIVLGLELANLKRAVDSGRAYGPELARVKAAAGAGIDLSTLERHKDSGVTTLAELARELHPLIDGVIDAESAPAEGSVVERLIAGAKSVVRVRKVKHDSDDNSPEARVARMEAALEDGRLRAVIEAAEAMAPKARTPLEPWLEKVRARHSIDVALAAVEEQLKSSLGAPAPKAP